MGVDLSVVISAHNPSSARLTRTLCGLSSQTLAPERWELVLVDNASTPPLALDLSALPTSHLVREDRLGLTFGRIAGMERSRAPIIVLVDDDNVVGPSYLESVLAIFAHEPRLGAVGGKSMPDWEAGSPRAWVEEFRDQLALRNFGEEAQIAALAGSCEYPACSPIGAGMAFRRAAVQSWLASCRAGGAPTDRRGRDLSSAGDCDMVMFALKDGWQVGYFPELEMTHVIPEGRTTREYLGRLNYGIAKSWVQFLARHGTRPWSKVSRVGAWLRKARAYVRYQAWAGPAQYVRWRGVCGTFDGRALIPMNPIVQGSPPAGGVVT